MVPVHPKKNLATASMVLGIVALVFCWFWYLSIPCGIIGLVLGIVAQKAGKIGMATAGIITSIIAIVIAVVIIIIAVIFVSSVMNNLNYYRTY